jgi:hypothetical protein
MKTPTHSNFVSDAINVIICALAAWLIIQCVRGVIKGYAEEEAIRRANREAARRERIEAHRERIKRWMDKRGRDRGHGKKEDGV